LSISIVYLFDEGAGGGVDAYGWGGNEYDGVRGVATPPPPASMGAFMGAGAFIGRVTWGSGPAWSASSARTMTAGSSGTS
jgi:hypothetical protein